MRPGADGEEKRVTHGFGSRHGEQLDPSAPIREGSWERPLLNFGVAAPCNRPHLIVLGAVTRTRPDGPDPYLKIVLPAMNVLLVTTARLIFLT